MDYSIIDLPGVRLLTEEETRTYIEKAQEGDKKALDKVVEHNLKLVLKVTYRYKNLDYNLQDLFQIGVVGLIKAVKGFDLKRDVKFSTYAFSRILGEIRLHIRDDGIINISRNLKKIARIVRKKEEELRNKLKRQPTLNELVEETDYSKEEIIKALEANKKPTSIYQPTHKDEGKELYLIDNLEDEQEKNNISEEDRLTLMDIIKELDPRSRKLIFLRYFEDKTQQEIGEELGVSQVQISRLEKKILKKIKRKMSS